MKRMNLLCVLTAVAAMFVINLPVSAASDFRAKANVPFEFEVAGTHMPAGEYTIFPSAIEGVLQIQNDDGKSVMVAIVDKLAVAPNKTPNTHLVFVDKDGVKHLSQIWSDAADFGAELPIK